MISPFILYQFIDFLYKILIFWAEKTGDQNLGGANLRCSTVGVLQRLPGSEL